MNRILQNLANAPGALRFLNRSNATKTLAARYLAGETLEQAKPVFADLTKKGLKFSVDYLNPMPRTQDQSTMLLEQYEQIINDLSCYGADAEINLRPSAFGSHGSAALNRITRMATNAGLNICIAAEEPHTVSNTLNLYSQLQQDFPNIAVTLQTNLHRSQRDISRLLLVKPRIRVCKSSYRTNETITNRLHIDQSFVHTIRRLLDAGCTALIATHDPRIIEICEVLLRRAGNPDHEFQMRLGIRDLEQRRLSDIGHPVRVLVPFGPCWSKYFANRTAARPRSLTLLARSLIRRK